MYKAIIVGGGAAGLFCGAQAKVSKGLILEACPNVGQKLLVSGSGHCNLTHSGNIKDFVNCYGDNGSKVRTSLYKFTNTDVMDFFRINGLEIITREDGKVFPKSMSSKDVKNLLVEKVLKNNWEIKTNEKVLNLEIIGENSFKVHTAKDTYLTSSVVVSTGGCSYPKLGSDGSMFEILEKAGIKIITPKPALVPIFVENYPFETLSGISFKDIKLTVTKTTPKNSTACQDNEGNLTLKKKKKKPLVAKGDLLFTHKNFSGPGILDISRNISPGDELKIQFYNGDLFKHQGVKKNLTHFITDETGLPERFVQCVLKEANANPNEKTASVSGSTIKKLYSLLTEWTFTVSGNAGFSQAMATSGGVALSEISTRTFESKKHPGLFIIGEALDVDGNTGGYNLQFAFSSATAVSSTII